MSNALVYVIHRLSKALAPYPGQVHLGDIILISLRDFQDEKCDVILKYMPDEARNLKVTVFSGAVQ